MLFWGLLLEEFLTRVPFFLLLEGDIVLSMLGRVSKLEVISASLMDSWKIKQWKKELKPPLSVDMKVKNLGSLGSELILT